MTHPNIRQWYRSYGQHVFILQLVFNGVLKTLMGDKLRAVDPEIQRNSEMLSALRSAMLMQIGYQFQDQRMTVNEHFQLQEEMRTGKGIVWERRL